MDATGESVEEVSAVGCGSNGVFIEVGVGCTSRWRLEDVSGTELDELLGVKEGGGR